jgi:hypothetical protein
MMIARHGGEERVHTGWRPAALAGDAAGHWSPEPEELLDPDLTEPQPRDASAAGSRRWRALIGLAAVVVIAAIAGQQHHRSGSMASLPSTPGRWVDEWTAASLENPARICEHLFAPALAAAFNADSGRFNADSGRSCLAYYRSVTSRSYRIRHVLHDGPTAAVEAQQVGDGRQWGDFTLILSHVRDGWQAVDVVPGGLVRPR